MLNQNQSNKINFLKLFIILPFLVIFLVSFNTKEIVKFSEPSKKLIPITNANETPNFTSPIRQSQINKISSGFGPAKDPISKKMKFHNGVDLTAVEGTEVTTSEEGVVKTSSSDNEKGNYVVVEHEDGYQTKYFHMKDRVVNTGEVISSGSLIGHVGNTGRSTGPHLHFEILKSEEHLDPASIIPFKASTTVKSRKVQKKPSSNQTSIVPKSAEFIINKNTSDQELETIKNDLKKDGIDFSYTVVHNEKQEITDISMQIAGKGKNGETFNNNYNASDETDGISPVVILIDINRNLISIGSKDDHQPSIFKISKNNSSIWIDSDDSEHKEIRIKKVNGKRLVIIDGEEISEEDLENMEIHNYDDSHIFITKESNHSDENIIVHSNSDSNSNDGHEIRIVTKKGNGSLLLDSEGGKKPLYILDGKEVGAKKIRKLKNKTIESVEVSKGDKAIEKYGQKAKDGVVEITTKKNK